ncbi:MAG: aromatic ring-hydroxylating dioxygenase subunit alpha [Pseudomonadota bacterium]
MSRDKLIAMARYSHQHAQDGTIAQVDDILQVPARNYVDATRWEDEMRQVFRRLPLMLAITAEVREPGDYKAMEVAGVPVLIARTKSGVVKAFLNSCSHRGAQIMLPGSGNTHRFTCPYHAWTYNHDGELIAVYAEKDFGAVDKSCNGLVELPCCEAAGMVWVTLDPHSPLAIEDFLSGYDEMLANFGFADWHLYESRTLEGPNWKIAYDGYMDLYHLPILHRETFGPQMSNQALYTAWGPHQRVVSPDRNLAVLQEKPEVEWEVAKLMSGVWTVFPHISIASFDGGGGRGVMISQLFPGTRPDQSFTTQLYVLENQPPDEEVARKATEQFEFLKHVVQNEDYATGLRQQTALASGLKESVMFGRNEGGGQHFHGWLEKLLVADNQALGGMFSRDTRPVVHGDQTVEL